ncbi:hypothetical protein LCGC14_2403730 [marine sediment metagenome]|uniref:Uncharacterized protein n=1 Tax=marine sediment metagenome TaxID=412755 RepID=A0A0F9ENY5_9ZZZZ
MIEVDYEYRTDEGWATQTIKLDVDLDMSLSDETLNDDMCALPRTIAYYSEISAECQAMTARRKNYMEVAEAAASQRIRAAAKESGDKITEPGIKEQVVSDDAVREARDLYYEADRQHRMLDGFYRALREKASISIAICYKQKEEMRTMNSPLE